MTADVGFFGPRSVSWRIHKDSSAILGAGRALLIQALHPMVMAVFEQNSDYRDDPWGRLGRTGAYFTDVIYGDAARARSAAEAVRALHARLEGFPDAGSGRVYRADDPDLLLWVHAAAVDSFLTAYRWYGGRVSRHDADRYVREMVVAAELIGIRPADAPASEAELRECLRGFTGLRVTPGAREGMHMILFEPPIPEMLRPLWSVVGAAVVAILPPEVRALYGLRWFSPADAPLRATVYGACRLYNAWSRARPVVDRVGSRIKLVAGSECPARPGHKESHGSGLALPLRREEGSATRGGDFGA
jgi:uncharacterized protein (DUF2236 family)